MLSPVPENPFPFFRCTHCPVHDGVVDHLLSVNGRSSGTSHWALSFSFIPFPRRKPPMNLAQRNCAKVRTSFNRCAFGRAVMPDGSGWRGGPKFASRRRTWPPQKPRWRISEILGLSRRSGAAEIKFWDMQSDRGTWLAWTALPGRPLEKEVLAQSVTDYSGNLSETKNAVTWSPLTGDGSGFG